MGGLVGELVGGSVTGLSTEGEQHRGLDLQERGHRDTSQLQCWHDIRVIDPLTGILADQK